MKTETEDRTIARVGKVAIGQYTYGFWVAGIGATGEKSRNPGEEAFRQQTYHGTLADACEAAALRVAHDYQAATLQAYAQSLRGAIAELRALIESHAIAPGPPSAHREGPTGSRTSPAPSERPERQIRKVSATRGTFRATHVPKTRKRRNG